MYGLDWADDADSPLLLNECGPVLWSHMHSTAPAVMADERRGIHYEDIHGGVRYADVDGGDAFQHMDEGKQLVYQYMDGGALVFAAPIPESAAILASSRRPTPISLPLTPDAFIVFLGRTCPVVSSSSSATSPLAT